MSLLYRLFRIVCFPSSFLFFLLRQSSLGYSLERSRPPLYFLPSFLFTLTPATLFPLHSHFTFHVLQLHQLDSIISSSKIVMKRVGERKEQEMRESIKKSFCSLSHFELVVLHFHQLLINCCFKLRAADGTKGSFLSSL